MNRDMIGFRPDGKTEAVIQAERERLSEMAGGTAVTKSMAIRSLLCRASVMVEKADADA